MGYFDRLPLISPGTLVATSQGVAIYMATGHLADGFSISRSLMQLKRSGCTFLEPSDEWISTTEEITDGFKKRGPVSIKHMKT